MSEESFEEQLVETEAPETQNSEELKVWQVALIVLGFAAFFGLLILVRLALDPYI